MSFLSAKICRLIPCQLCNVKYEFNNHNHSVFLSIIFQVEGRWRSGVRTVFTPHCVRLLPVSVCVPGSCPGGGVGKHDKLARPQSSFAWARSQNIKHLHEANLSHMVTNIIALTVTIVLGKDCTSKYTRCISQSNILHT